MTPASVGHQCPECIAEGRKGQRPALTAFGGSATGAHGYATITLIAINCVMLILSALSMRNPGSALGGGSLGGLLGGATPLTNKLGVIGEIGCSRPGGPLMECAYGVSDGEYYRLFTAMFMHYGIVHLLLNMYALWFLGRPLEALLGPIRFTAVYLVCGIAGDVAVYVFSPGTESAGASTALFGLFGVFFFVLRKLGRSVSGLVPVLVINLFITFIVPGISIAGHIGGLIAGVAIGYGVVHAPRQRRVQIQTAVIVGALLVLGVATALQTMHLSGLPQLGIQ
jgi:membrane associated rhomboid family serine protease